MLLQEAVTPAVVISHLPIEYRRRSIEYHNKVLTLRKICVLLLFVTIATGNDIIPFSIFTLYGFITFYGYFR